LGQTGRWAALTRVACAAIALGVALPALAVQLTDDRGVTVTLAAPPQRIVSLLPSLTETVCELGQCPRLVGVDRYSNWPASVASLPRVGGGLDPSIEAVVALKPDLVLLATSTRAAARLEALGIKVVALEPRNMADVRRVLAQVGRASGKPSASGSASRPRWARSRSRFRRVRAAHGSALRWAAAPLQPARRPSSVKCWPVWMRAASCPATWGRSPN